MTRTKTRKYLSKIFSLILGTILLSGIVITSSATAQAQRVQRRVIIVRPYRPFRPFGWNTYPYRYNSVYGRYIFDNGDRAVDQGYNDGYKTGKEDGQKAKSYSPERSHYFHDAGFGNFAEASRDGFSRRYHEGYDSGRNG